MMIVEINTDPEFYTLLWWCIGVSALALVCTALFLCVFIFEWHEGLAGLFFVVGSLAIIAAALLWLVGLVGAVGDGEFDQYQVSGEIVAIAGDIAILDGVPTPLDLGASSGTVEVGDKIVADCKLAYGEYTCYEVENMK